VLYCVWRVGYAVDIEEAVIRIIRQGAQNQSLVAQKECVSARRHRLLRGRGDRCGRDRRRGSIGKPWWESRPFDDSDCRCVLRLSCLESWFIKQLFGRQPMYECAPLVVEIQAVSFYKQTMTAFPRGGRHGNEIKQTSIRSRSNFRCGGIRDDQHIGRRKT